MRAVLLSLLVLTACSAAKPRPEAAPSTAAAAPAATAAAPAKPAPPVEDKRTLFDRLGGLPAIEAVVTEFTKNVAADERINAPFAVADLEAFHKRLVEFFCVATGGPCTYSGRSMREAHLGMGVTGGQFDAIAGDLVKTLDALHVPEKEKGEILNAVGPTRKDIVEVE